MGNSSSSSGRSQHDDSVDYGALSPQGVYTGPQDWNQSVVSQLIVSRKLAPFYRPLDDYDDSWDDDQILAARKESSNPESADSVTRIEPSTGSTRSKRPSALKEPAKPEAQVYRGAVECPICFLVSTFYRWHLTRLHFSMFSSIILPISITQGVAIKRFAQNALSR